MFKKHKREALTLRRDLNLFDATLAGVGIIVGAGIYVLIGAASGYAGNAVWLSFLIAAAVALMTGLSYAELSSIYPVDSGEYSYVEHAFSKVLAFITGYMVSFSLVVSVAAVSYGLAGYLNMLVGLEQRLPTAIFVVILFSLVNLLGISFSIKINTVLTALSVVGLLAVIALSWGSIGKVNYFEVPNLTGVFQGAALIFFAYIGFESVVKLSEETQNPRRTIPLALLFSIGISTVLYILVAFSAVSVVGWRELSASKAPLSLVASSVLGGHAGVIVSIIAIVATGNTVLISLIALSRVLYGFGQKYQKLKLFATVNNDTGTPHIAVIISCILALAFVFLKDLELVAQITNFAVFFVFAIINLAAIRLRYIRHKREMFHEPLNFGRFPVLALLGFFSSILMILHLEKRVAAIGAGIILSGAILYMFLENTISFKKKADFSLSHERERSKALGGPDR